MEAITPTKKSSRKQQIRETAQRLFKERGYSATSMRDLAREVGIEPASLYNHISSKESILKDICFGMADEFFKAVEDIYYMNLAPDEKLKLAIGRHINVILNNLEASSVFFNEWRSLNGDDLAKFKSLRINYEWKFKEILNQGIRTNTFKDIDVKIVIFTIFSSLNAIYDLCKPGSDYDAENVANKMTDILLNGLIE